MERTLREIADFIGGEVLGDDRVSITGINSIDRASRGEISFFFDSRYEKYIGETKASALLTSNPIETYHGSQVLVPDPKLAYARVAGIFAPPVPKFPGISHEAIIQDTSSIGRDTSIYPMVYIGKDSVIGDDVILFPGVFIGDRVKIGDRTVVYPNVTILQDCVVGSDVIIHAGCVIGSDGFGFVRDGAKNIKIPQLGNVRIDDHVEIGANTTIDRAAIGNTRIRSGVKTDNLIQIAHNVEIGEDTVIVALTGISGSVRIGREVIIGGQVGIGDHLEIGDKVMIGSKSGVYKSLPGGDVVSGNPTMAHRIWLKTTGLIHRLPRMYEDLRDLQKRVRKLEKSNT